MSPGKRPRPSLLITGHNRPIATSTTPNMINRRDAFIAPLVAPRRVAAPAPQSLCACLPDAGRSVLALTSVLANWKTVYHIDQQILGDQRYADRSIESQEAQARHNGARL